MSTDTPQPEASSAGAPGLRAVADASGPKTESASTRPPPRLFEPTTAAPATTGCHEQPDQQWPATSEGSAGARVQGTSQAQAAANLPVLAPGDDVFDERTLTKSDVYSCHIRGVHHPVDSSVLPDEYQMSIKCTDICS